jgi:dihydrofolate reductase
MSAGDCFLAVTNSNITVKPTVILEGKTMREVILAMQMTLDGFSTGPNGEMDWLPPFDNEELWRDLHREMWSQLADVDTFLLGRKTYQIWEQYWPAAGKNPSLTESDRKFSAFADQTQKVVFSTTLEKVTWPNSNLIREDIVKEVLKMKQLPGKNMLLAGGAGLAQTFTKLGLIDEYQITVHPVILGRGQLLLKDLNVLRRLNLKGTKNYRNGAVGLYYEPTQATIFGKEEEKQELLVPNLSFQIS